MDASFNASKRYSDKCKWICIYPLYLNARKTIAHGRRISKQKAVDSPTSQEIYDVLSNTGFKVQLEKDKMHPLEPNRDPNAKGRVRVQLHNDDGTPFNEKFPTKMSVMLYVCEMIPKLKNRQGGGGSGPQTTAPGVKTSRKNKKR
uniref:Signal recognition particle 19 kDa protein n=1 Tax=Parascaris univalens TaxID=6257 RepID=A0A915B443_PARUN